MLRLKKSILLSGALLLSTMGAFAKKTILDVNVGFPQGVDPVPLTADCICVQTPGTIFYGADVEVTIAVNPKNPCQIVAAWQNDRIDNGGALEIGVAHSEDGGQTWVQTVVPFQICIGGINQRVSDPWLSYSADGKVVYLNVLPFNANLVANTPNQSGIATAVSHDNGATWDAPVYVTTSFNYNNEPTGQFAFPDKNSITADPNDPCTAYCVWEEFNPLVFPDGSLNDNGPTMFSFTSNKGKTWNQPKQIYQPFTDLVATGLGNGIFNDCQTISNIIVVAPKCKGGVLYNFMTRLYATPNATDLDYVNDAFPYQFTLSDLAVIRSFDKGLNWETTATIVGQQQINATIFTGGLNVVAGQIVSGNGTLLRTPNFGCDAAINPKNGNLYAVWQTNVFNPVTLLPTVALSRSRDGGNTWSAPVQVSQTPPNVPNPQAFTPAVAVTEDGFVGIVYTDFRFDTSSDSPATPTDCWLAIFKETANPNGGSTGVGLDFVREQRLSQQSYIAQNGPATTQGVMTNGDYSFVTAAKNTFYAIYTKTFNGPFQPAAPFPGCTQGPVIVDNNYRQAPFVSVVPAQ